MNMALSGNDLIEIEAQTILAAKSAGDCILGFYGIDGNFSVKADGSPLTRADKASHEVIVETLSRLGFPIVSEEAPELGVTGTYYWLVDPLDGTKDFLARNHEFTVNIALIEGDRPIMGAVYAPEFDELYFGVVSGPVWREEGGIRVPCSESPRSTGLRMAKSRFHDQPCTVIFAEANRVQESIPIGAALKYGRLAMAEVDVYPRMVGTSEWDTAAGQAILEASGGQLVDLHTGRPLGYGKPKRRNGHFLAFRSPYRFSDFIGI